MRFYFIVERIHIQWIYNSPWDLFIQHAHYDAKKVENKLITNKYYAIFLCKIRIDISLQNNMFIKTRKIYFMTMQIYNNISTEAYNLISVMSCNMTYIICLFRMSSILFILMIHQGIFQYINHECAIFVVY